MRIKIIGDNNCARATRHLLRMAGFAVTEFLPAEAITQAPHHGYAITIELAPAAHPPTHSSTPDHSTHAHSASVHEETSTKAKADAGVSSPFAPKGGATAGGPSSQSKAEDAAGLPASDFGESNGSAGFSLRGVSSEAAGRKGAQAEAYATGSHICFDSVDGALEGAILRHVTQLAAAPVIVDRPGGVVHSERELRIVVPFAINAQGNA